MQKKIWRKAVIVATTAALLASLFYMLRPAAPAGGGGAAPERFADNRTAADISNMTGVSTEEILRLRNAGLDWNAVLERLRREEIDETSGKAARLNALSEESVDSGLVRELAERGYAEDKIIEARMLAERVQYQLKDLLNHRPADRLSPVLEGAMLNEQARKSRAVEEVWQKIASGFELAAAMRLMLQLEEAFGSMQAVLDEYLFALQADLNLADYLTDRERYEEQRNERRALLGPDGAVTSSSIEQAVLERLRENAAAEDEEPLAPQVGTAAGETTMAGGQSAALPDSPLPDVPQVGPVNPAQDIMRELEAINPNK